MRYQSSISLARYDALMRPWRLRDLVCHTFVSSTSPRASLSTLIDHQQSFQLFPQHIQNTITLLQDQFNRCVNTDERLFELYDKNTTEQMWKATMKRNSIQHDATGMLDADDTTKMITKQAGVLVLFVHEGSNLSIVFTRRSKDLSSHASQISFPGGHYEEETDATIVDTAIREAVEELHASDDKTTKQKFRQNLYIFGSTTAVPSLRGIPVTSVLGLYHTSNMTSTELISKIWPGNPSEVEVVFTMPVTKLIKEQKLSSSSADSTVFDRTSWSVKSPSPKYPTPHGTIWGLTGYILQPIIHKMLIPFVDNKASEEMLDGTERT